MTTLANTQPNSTFILDGSTYVVAHHGSLQTTAGDTLLYDGRGYDKFGRPFYLIKNGNQHVRDYNVRMSGAPSNNCSVPAQKRSKTYFPHGPRLYFCPSMGR